MDSGRGDLDDSDGGLRELTAETHQVGIECGFGGAVPRHGIGGNEGDIGARAASVRLSERNYCLCDGCLQDETCLRLPTQEMGQDCINDSDKAEEVDLHLVLEAFEVELLWFREVVLQLHSGIEEN